MKTAKTLVLVALLSGSFQLQHLSAQISGQVVNFCLNRYNSASNGDKVTVHDGEILGSIHWRGWTPGNEYQTSTMIRSVVTGVPAAGYLPSRMIFYTGGFNQIERMTILENGYVGIGLANPAELVDINGNVIVRGTKLSLGLGSSFGDGGEAITHSDRDCSGALLPDEVLTLNNDGGFPGGVYVEGPGGLHVCETMESNCLQAENNIVSENGNLVALGGAVIAVACNPGDGDFIAEGANGDFIARHGDFLANEGDFTAQQGAVTARLNLTSQTGDVVAQTGNVTAGNNVSATNDISAGGNFSANGNATVNGTVRIGSITGNPGTHRLAVGGSIISEEVNVALQGDWPDYVFTPEHQLLPLTEVENFIAENKHLPGIPSAGEIANEGLALGKMQTMMMEKLEELYLHVIELNKKVEELEKVNKRLKGEKE